MARRPDAKRVTCTLYDDEYERLVYWANKNNMSVNEYIKEAIELAIRHENKDYDLPALEIQRLNQLVDNIAVLSSNVKSIEEVVIHGFDSLLGLTKGDNYLLEREDGEL